MTSAARTTRSGRGFTLIEIVMVLAIAAVITGGAVGLMVYSSDERVLRDASGEIELLAKRARTISILKQTPYALEFRQGIVRLLPLAQAGQGQRESRKNPILTEESSDPDEDRSFSLDPNLAVFIRHWNSNDWLGTAKNGVQVWRFDPDGLCEPISVRLTLENSWMEDTYHPLTATIRESQLEAR